jgi:hypothetical protein
VLVLIRLAAVPVFAAAERLVDHPVANSALFGPLIVLAAVYALAALAGELRGTPARLPARARLRRPAADHRPRGDLGRPVLPSCATPSSCCRSAPRCCCAPA